MNSHKNFREESGVQDSTLIAYPPLFPHLLFWFIWPAKGQAVSTYAMPSALPGEGSQQEEGAGQRTT